MKSLAGAMSDEDGLSGLVQPVAEYLDGLRMRIVANVSHVLPPCPIGGPLPEIRGRPPRFRRAGFSAATARPRDLSWGSGHDRTPRVVTGGDGSATSPFKRGKRGNGRGYRSPLLHLLLLYSLCSSPFIVLLALFSSSSSSSSIPRRGIRLPWRVSAPG